MNRRGQALIEAIICSVIWAGGTLFLLKTAYHLTTLTLLDDWTDEILLCQTEECAQKFRSRLALLQISEYQTTRNNATQMTFTANSPLGQIKISKETSL